MCAHSKTPPSQDIRWKQRLDNFQSAFAQLKNALDISKKRELSDLEKQGLIQSFEFTHELACKVMKDYFHYQGNSELTGSRDATREAFAAGLLDDGDAWMEMIQSRNRTSHTYNKKVADDIVKKILDSYVIQFGKFNDKMVALAKK